jgi:hypothetical protein
VNGFPAAPDGWRLLEKRSSGPFTTAVTYLHPDGRRIHWSSRPHRKRSGRLVAGRDRRDHPYWAPRRAWWWMAVLFSLGSVCFLVGPVPAFLNLVGPDADAAVFFAGSLLFTAAAVLQLRETLRTDHTAPDATGHRARWFTWEPRRIDWWSSVVQLLGTLFFNITTFRALSTAIDSPSYDRLVWRPDAYGSVCFLVAGALAYVEVSGHLWHRPPRSLEGRLVSVNLFGCVAFAFSAVGAYVLPASGSDVNLAIANLTTSIGALAFLVGALMLLPEGAMADKRVSEQVEGT